MAEPQGTLQPQKVPKIQKGMVQLFLGLFITLFGIEVILYLLFFKHIPDFLKIYSPHILLLTVSALSNAVAIWHIKAHKRLIPCMTGMMLGMTIGMTLSLSIGIILGLTNGMFYGALAAIILGMAGGAWVGSCCGIMGTMEGMMAGLMGGTMGPMIPLMALEYALPLNILVLVAVMSILVGLIIMLYKEELAIDEKSEYKGYPLLPYIVICAIILLALTLLLVYGPHSLLIQ